MIRFSIFLAVVGSFLLVDTRHASATADGPDIWQVVASTPVALRDAPNVNARIVRMIEPATRGLRSLECTGRTPFEIWIKLSDEERQQSRAKTWCKITFAGATGWLNGTEIGEPKGKAPAYNCAKAVGAVEELICRDDELARLDHDLTAAYWNAIAAVMEADFSQMKPFRQGQRDWIESRNDCGTASNMRECVLDRYRSRISFLKVRSTQAQR